MTVAEIEARIDRQIASLKNIRGAIPDLEQTILDSVGNFLQDATDDIESAATQAGVEY